MTHKMDRGKDILFGTAWSNHDFGYTCYFPSILVDNLTWKGLPAGTTDVYITTFVPSDENAHKATLANGDKNLNPYIPPKSIKSINNNSGYNYKIYYAPFFAETELDGVKFAN